MKKIICESENDLPSAAKKLISYCQTEKIFAFFGELGAGKTTFIKAICKYLCVEDEVSSPSFSLINEYKIEIDSEKEKIIHHFDFYRIKKEEEVYDLGYEDYFYSGNYCFIEWPEKIIKLLPPNYVMVVIKEKDNKRTITIQKEHNITI